jgi:hypothetical protein
MAEKWKMTGDLLDSCNCDPGCPCFFYSDPTKGKCNSLWVFHTRSGNYGDVKLDGLSVALVTMSPGNFWKGNLKAAIYFDETANPKQKEALETIFGGKAGGAPATLAGLIGSMMGSKTSKIEVDTSKKHVSIPGVLEYGLEPNMGGDNEPIGTTHHPFSPAIGTLNHAKGVSSHYSDYGTTLDNTGGDGVWATFDFSGP